MFKSLTLALLATFAVCAEEASKLSLTDQAAIDKAIEASLSEPSKAYQAYQAALTKAGEKAIKDLEKLKAGAMKGNNLPLAVAIDGKIAEVKKNGLGSVIVEKAEKAGDLLGDDKKVDIKTVVVGKWLAGPVALTINKDGSWTSPWPDFGGSWRIIKGQLEFTSTKGNNQIITVDPKEGAKWIWNGGKSGGVSSKVVE